MRRARWSRRSWRRLCWQSRTEKEYAWNFGDSSLNFELRVFLKEIEGRLGIISDLNFAIDKAFREANIEIPFPQRDVHVRTLPDKGDA